MAGASHRLKLDALPPYYTHRAHNVAYYRWLAGSLLRYYGRTETNLFLSAVINNNLGKSKGHRTYRELKI